MSIEARSPKPREGSFGRSLAIQARVLNALLLREIITRFGRYNVGVLWLFVEPMLFTLAVSALWVAAGLHQFSNLPIVAFAITGYSSVLLWRNTATHCTSAVRNNLNLLFHRNVRVIDVLAARIVLECAGASASFLLLSLLFIATESMSPPADLLKVLAGWLLLGWFGASLGLLLGAASAYSELVVRLWQPLAYILFPLSGAAFMVTALPPAAQEFVLLLPMVHGVEMVRDGFFGEVVRTRYDVSYLAGVSLVFTLLGLLMVRDVARRVGDE